MTDLTFRPFGHLATDLDLDFDRTLRPQLVTRILQLCTVQASDAIIEERFFWRLNVGKRIEYLLRIATIGETPEFAVHFNCQNQDCGRQIEVSITLEELTSLQHQEDEAHLPVRIGDHNFFFRRPTGDDQLKWQQRSFDSQQQAFKAMIQTLLVEPENGYDNSRLSDEEIENIGRAMQEFDPLVNFSFGIHCPYCEEEHTNEVELEALALDSLRHTQLRLTEDIHRLALHYHWSEADFYTIPSWRRRRYLTLLEREGVL